MEVFSTVIQLIIALSALIILHEVGHYIGAKLFKFEVDEFGIGIPPQALRFWRRKGSLTIGNMHIKIPAGIKFLQDFTVNTWIDTTVQSDTDGTYILQNIRILDTKNRTPENIKEQVEPGIWRIQGEVTDINQGMVFTLNWLPLGGFVKIRGEGDTSIPEGLAAANPWKRLVVYFFGPLMNLLLGVILYTVIVSQLGIADASTVNIIEVSPNSPAEAAGLQAGDIIQFIDTTPVDSMNTIHNVIYSNLGKEITLTYLRDGETEETTMVPREEPPEGEGAIGIVMGNPTEQISWFKALPYGAVSTLNHSIALVTLPGQVIKGAISPADARPVGYKGMYDIYQNVQDRELVPGAPQSLNVIWFFTTITISLGVLNLLPIPALDGGRILFALPEIIFRRKIPIQVQNVVNMISFTIMILLFFYINLLDFIQPIQLP
jgi:regulator of sigma E protease